MQRSSIVVLLVLILAVIATVSSVDGQLVNDQYEMHNGANYSMVEGHTSRMLVRNYGALGERIWRWWFSVVDWMKRKWKGANNKTTDGSTKTTHESEGSSHKKGKTLEKTNSKHEIGESSHTNENSHRHEDDEKTLKKSKSKNDPEEFHDAVESHRMLQAQDGSEKLSLIRKLITWIKKLFASWKSKKSSKGDTEEEHFHDAKSTFDHEHSVHKNDPTHATRRLRNQS